MNTEVRDAVREIVAHAKVVESDGSRVVAMVEVTLCLEDGRRVQAENRRRLVVDVASAYSQRSAVSGAVRAFLREAYGEAPVVSVRA